MKRAILIVLVVCLVFGVCACKQAEEPVVSAEQTPKVEVVTTPEPVVSAASGPVSLTTGLPVAEGTEYKPMIVMVENTPAARPQSGLNQADIVYEAMVESSITRFACVFNDTVPIEVGPVRSARLYYIHIQREWDAPYIHSGGAGAGAGKYTVYGSAFDDIKLRLDHAKGHYSKYYWRDSARGGGVHSLMINVKRVKDELYSYTPNSRDGFKFDAAEAQSGQTVEKISLPFVGSANYVEYVYDAATDKFTRYMGGSVFKAKTVTEDEKGKKSSSIDPVTVQNVIVQYANTYKITGDKKGRRMVDLIGEGKAEFFVGGKHLSGTWKRADMKSSTKYYLENGTELTLRPGNTWIELHPKDTAIKIAYK